MIEELIALLNKEDPQHALMFLGINEAADWVQSLTYTELNILTSELKDKQCLLDDTIILKILLLAKMTKHQVFYPFVLSVLNNDITEDVEYYANLAIKSYMKN